MPCASIVQGMPLVRAQVILPFFTNLPTDVIVNGFHFERNSVDRETAADEIQNLLQTFYETVYGNTTARANYIDWPDAVVKCFYLEDPTPRIPEIRNLGIVGNGTAASAVPTEVACVTTWHAAPQSGVRYQSLYNRIYLGGITTSHITTSGVDQFPRFTPTFIGNVNSAAAGLLDQSLIVGVEWRQVGRAGASPLTVSRPITGGWTDNGPDTQRRRSVLANSRANWSL